MEGSNTPTYKYGLEPTDLPYEELCQIINNLRALLWEDCDDDSQPVWNVHKEWDSEYIDYVAGELEAHGLKPIGPTANSDSDRPPV